MASRETQYQSNSSGSVRGIRRLLHLKKDPPASHHHPMITPFVATSSSAGPIKKKPGGGGGFPFRGLGCASSSSALQALVPADADAAAAAAVRSSAEWQGKRRPRKRRGKKKGGRAHPNSPPAADVSDVWCAPGVVFGAEASVDCVVAHRRERVHRERACIARRGGDEEIMSSFLDFSSMKMRHFGPGPLHSGHLHHLRGGHRRSPAAFEEMMMFETRVFLGGADVDDRYKDLRLDVDNMTYEELLELSERIGYVSTGLREEEIIRNLRKPKHIFGASPSQKEWKCTICQEEYEVNDDMGRLECGHSYHTDCIKQWLLRKNACPVCKTAMAGS